MVSTELIDIIYKIHLLFPLQELELSLTHNGSEYYLLNDVDNEIYFGVNNTGMMLISSNTDNEIWISDNTINLINFKMTKKLVYITHLMYIVQKSY